MRRIRAVSEETLVPEEQEDEAPPSEQPVSVPVSPSDMLTMFFKVLSLLFILLSMKYDFLGACLDARNSVALKLTGGSSGFAESLFSRETSFLGVLRI